MVVMNKVDCTEKVLSLLADTNTYWNINKDPTIKLKNKIIQMLRDIKQTGELSEHDYRKSVPNQCCPLKVSWPPQNSKKLALPSDPLCSAGAPLHNGVAKEWANIICPLVGQSPHHLKNTQHFVQHIQKVKLEPGEVMTSYNGKALFTSVPIDASIKIVKQKLIQDPTLPQRTNMSTKHIVTLLEFCFKITYFLFQGKYYEEVHGAAMGTTISPLIANLYMEEFKVKALSSAPHPHIWLRFVDDPLPSRRQNTANNLYSISTPKTHTYILSWKNQTKMDHFHSWTPRFHQAPTTPLPPQSTENLHIQINIYIGIVTISSR